MENASKALIIAGAIILSILLISLGIMIFGQAQDTVNNSGMSQEEVKSFNSKFIKYEGTAQKGSVVKSLLNEVIACNADPTLTTKIQVNLGGTNMKPIKTSGIDTKKTYKVEITTYSNTGYVSQITITAN